MGEWAPVLERYGVGLAILAVLAYFMLRHWWPYWKEKDIKAATDRRDQLNRMLNFQEGTMKEMTEAIRANTRQSEKIAEHLDALTEEVRARR